MATENSDNGANKNLLGQLWAIYFPYWPVFLALMFLGVILAWLKIQRTVPLYEATATLLIKDEKKGIDDPRMVESLNLFNTKKIVENEIEVLGSRSLMSDVVDSLKLYTQVFYKGPWRGRSAYSLSPILIEAKHPDSLADSSPEPFTVDTVTSTVRLGKDTFPINHWVNSKYGEIRIVPTKNWHKKSEHQYYFSFINPKTVTYGLMKKLDATPSSKLSTVIDLRLKDGDPSLAEDILNQLIYFYIRASLNDKNALASNTLFFVQQRLNIIGKHLDSIQRKIEQYKASRGAVDISSQGRIFLESVSVNDQKEADINMQLAALDQVEKYVLSKNQQQGVVPATLEDQGSLLNTLLRKLYDTEMEKQKISNTTGENDPTMIGLNNQIDQMRLAVRENIRTKRSSLEATKRSLQAATNSYSNMLQSLPQKERDLVEISRQENTENSIYSFLLQKREEAALSYSSTLADSRIVDKAQASLGPVSPNKMLIYLISIFVSVGIGVAALSAKEIFNTSVTDSSVIEDNCTFPVIGEIDYNKSSRGLQAMYNKNGRTPEQFRKLRASIAMNAGGHTYRKILVTSTSYGDGKTFVAANLGLSLALSGKSVVLIEADMSSTSFKELTGLKGQKGLTDYLTGKSTIEEILQTDGTENLRWIAGGAAVNYPSELFLSSRMDALVDELSKKFDYVIIDTAPVSAMSDAYVLTRLCDTTLYIVRQGKTPKQALVTLEKTNRVNVLKNVQIVLNGIQNRGAGQIALLNKLFAPFMSRKKQLA